MIVTISLTEEQLVIIKEALFAAKFQTEGFADDCANMGYVKREEELRYQSNLFNEVLQIL